MSKPRSPRFRTTLFGVFSGTALLLALTGVYGVTAYSVAERRREIAIRLALGAKPDQVVRMVLWHAAMPLVAGVAAGAGGAAALGRLLSGYLFGTTPLDASVFAAAAVLILTTALVANYLPSRRGAAIDPMATLRHG